MASLLKHRIIPILLWDGVSVVQSTQFSRPHRKVGSIVQFVENMEKRNVDELIILDVNASLENRKPLFNDIKKLTSNLFCPLTYGGGISSLDDIKILVQDCGIDKVSIKSNFSLIHSAARKFGTQAIVYAADFKDNGKIDVKNTPSKFKWNRWLKLVESEGAGELLLTDMSLNGQQKGYNISLIKKVAGVVNIPIIANGGGTINSMPFAIEAGANAVAASSLFLFTDTTPRNCAEALDNYGINVRLDRVGSPQRGLGRPALEAIS